MTRTKLLLIAAALTALFAFLLTGCDELITENITNIEAGHPDVEFAVVPDSGCENLTVDLQDNSVGPRDRGAWYFYRGSQTTPFDSIVITRAPGSSESVNADTAYTFSEAGVYAIRLSISNAATEGSDSYRDNRAVIVGTSVLDFGASDTIACAGTEITFEPNVNDWGAVNTWSWNFGDGTPASNDSVPSHTYADTGSYTVTLTATGPCGVKQIVDSNLIIILPCPSIVIVADTTEGCVPLDITFRDSTQLDPDAGLVINTRIWNLGNGGNPGSQSIATARYSTAGVYTPRLSLQLKGVVNGDSVLITVTDSIPNYITAYAPTTAEFSALTPTEDCISPFQQFQVLFQPTQAGDFDSLIWRFGDGTFLIDTGATPKSPVHAYFTAGVYDISLEAYGPCGADTVEQIGMVTLMAPLGAMAIAVADTLGDTSTVFQFDDNSPGIITSRTWTFGDAAVGTGEVVTHKYADTGLYTVTLIIGNLCGTVADSFTVHVVDPADLPPPSPAARPSTPPTIGSR